jgi:hypothetical protein
MHPQESTALAFKLVNGGLKVARILKLPLQVSIIPSLPGMHREVRVRAPMLDELVAELYVVEAVNGLRHTSGTRTKR